MPSFRNSREKARHATEQVAAIGTARHGRTADEGIHSLGTLRNYRGALALFDEWLNENRLGDVTTATREVVMKYLEIRSEEVRQKTLDMDRQAIQSILKEKLPVVKSELDTIRITRSYTSDQLKLVKSAQSSRNAFSTELARFGGLRAAELLTIWPADKRPASSHREWRPNRFAGMGDVAIYTVIGKGGLVREVALSRELSAELEKHRLDTPRIVVDRGIKREQHYDIAGGRNWSQSVSAASTRALGWSQGAHGACRHSYAQERMAAVQAMGYTAHDARCIVSQELGHFRPDIVDAYLR